MAACTSSAPTVTPSASPRVPGASACRPIEPERLVAAMRALARVEQDSIPEATRGSLYLRPVLFASDEYLGVRPGTRHTLAILASPVDSYFGQDVRPLRLWAERELTRAAPGGLGAAKTGGNYAASLLAAQRAKQRGFDQVLWLDAVSHSYLEEVGTMNLFVHLKDRGVVTPPADGTILAGVTRDCCLTLLREWGIPTEERRLTLAELRAADASGELLEIFGTGTAARWSRRSARWPGREQRSSRWEARSACASRTR